MTGTEINRLLEGRLVDLAGRKLPGSIGEQQARAKTEGPALLKSLGIPPSTGSSPLDGDVLGTVQRDGYRIEKTVYYSRPGFLVTGHLYLPAGEGPSDLILRPHGEWVEKMGDPAVQAFAVSFALAGYAVFVVESPGFEPELDPTGQRALQGNRNDPWLAMGASPSAVYAWDLMRAIDLLQMRKEIDVKRVGIAAEDSGAAAAALAFVADSRIHCFAAGCFGGSRKIFAKGGPAIPTAAALGDVSDLLALRAPSPILLMSRRNDGSCPAEAVAKTGERLRSVYKVHGQESAVRVAAFEGTRDFDRRMRETALAFFNHYLRGAPAAEYQPEARPITDGSVNRYRAETLEPSDPALVILPPDRRSSRSMAELVQPTQETAAYDALGRLVPWAKYGKLPASGGPKLTIRDQDWPLEAIDLGMCSLLGISAAELIAQVLHLATPGGHANWEEATLGATGDLVTSLIGSVKTLVRTSSPELPVHEVEALGPVASMAALFFKALRPEVTITVSHEWHSWDELYRRGSDALVQPGSPGLGWPATAS